MTAGSAEAKTPILCTNFDNPDVEDAIFCIAYIHIIMW